MACCFDEIGEYAVTPILTSPSGPEPCCFETTTYCTYLPHCPKKQTDCYENKLQSKYPKMSTSTYNCCSDYSERPRSPICPKFQTAHLPQEYCPTCKSPCKPAKTKYVIPCYRYEDGRIERYVPTRHGRLPKSVYSTNGIQDQIHGYRGAIRYLCAGVDRDRCCVYTAVEPIRRLYPKVNQPTTLMRRACEVAVGARPRRKPFIVSSFSANPDQEIHRNVSEDEQGNCGYHFEKRKHDYLCSEGCYSYHYYH